MSNATERQIAYINSLLDGFAIAPEAEAYLYRTLEAIKSESNPQIARTHELNAMNYICGQLGLLKDQSFEWTKQDLGKLIARRQRRIDAIRISMNNGFSKDFASSLINKLQQSYIPNMPK